MGSRQILCVKGKIFISAGETGRCELCKRIAEQDHGYDPKYDTQPSFGR